LNKLTSRIRPLIISSVPSPIKDVFKAVVLRNRGREELRKIIFKALDLDREPANETPQDKEAAPQERKVSPEEALIENILDMIPIF